MILPSDSAQRMPLVAIEHYMLADDRPDYPMSFFLRLKLDGRLERAAFERAIELAATRHPLLRATLDGAPGRRRYWTWRKTVSAVMLWNEPHADPGPGLDLTREAGLRFKVDERDGKTSLLMQFHHSCCDGLGAVAFAKDLLAEYAAQMGDRAAGEAAEDRATEDPPPAALKRLAQRGHFGLGLMGLLLRAPLELLGLLGVVEFYSHRPLPLTGSADGAPPTSPWPDECSHEFTLDETKALKATAERGGATLNDLLVRDAFLAAGDWIVEHDPDQRGKHVRVMVPVNLRTRQDRDLSAANVVAMINLDRRPHRWRNRERMLRMLHWEMWVVKRARLGLTFIRGIQLVHYVFGQLPRMMPANKCLATCVLSNLGEPWRGSQLVGADGRVKAGNVTVSSIELLPPIRPLTRAAFGVVTYAGRLIVTLHYDRRALTPAEGEQLLATLVRQLKASAAETS